MQEICSSPLHLAKDSLQFSRTHIFSILQHCSHRIVQWLREKKTQARQQSRSRRHNYLLYLQLFSNLAGEHWSCSPKRHERHFTWIKSLLYRRRMQRVHNLRQIDSQNTDRSIDHIHSKPLRNQLSHGRVRKLRGQRQISRKQEAWTQTPENEGRIRQRRQPSTLPVARRTGRRSSTLRTDM